MWTLVFKPEHNEYDAVPNVWLVDEKKCMYPDKCTQTLKKMAKEEAAVENEGWDVVKIRIVKRDYENFERCMTDVIRHQKGKRSLTESEQETRGKSLREKKKRKMTSEEESSDATSSEEDGRGSQYLFPKKNAQKLVSPQPTKQTDKESPLGLFHKKKSLLSTSSTISKPRERSPEKDKYQIKNCKLTNSRHFCVKKGGHASLDDLADGLCSISRSVVSLRAYSTEQFDTLKSQLSAMQKTLDNFQQLFQQYTKNADRLQSLTATEQPIVPDEEIQELASTWFPVDSEANFEELEKLLKNSVFREKIVHTLTTLGATSSSSSRALSSMLKECLSPTLTSTFSWKGQKKLGSKKKAFNETAFQKVLFSAARKRFSYDDSKIEKTVKTWLQQTAYEIQHPEKVGNPSTTQHNP